MLLLVAPPAVTIKELAALWIRPPLVPVIVSVLVPAGVFVAVVTVNMEEPEPLTEVGLKLLVAPEGSPLSVKPTLPLNPFNALTVAV
jgi:hypothetical protein